MSWKSKWGDGCFGEESLPQECIEALSGSGDHKLDAELWCEKLKFDKGFPVARGREYLEATGGWEPEDTRDMSRTEVAQAVLWLAACDISEDGIFDMNSH